MRVSMVEPMAPLAPNTSSDCVFGAKVRVRIPIQVFLSFSYENSLINSTFSSMGVKCHY